MKKLLTLCIPTYKREKSLRRCIDSVLAQVKKSGLADDVGVFVANDASPDGTKALLEGYRNVNYFRAVNRETNLGMSANIKNMLEEVTQQSDYQLIITDDDFLEADALAEIVATLQVYRNREPPVAAIWTPRYSYTEDGTLHCVVCDPFRGDFSVLPSAFSAGRYMENGFVLSGLIIYGNQIDFDFWGRYAENAYFPSICFGDIVHRCGAQFWKKSIVHHTVLNECHWERWGKNDVVIELRLFSDYVGQYAIMAGRMGNFLQKVQFYFGAFPSIYRAVAGLLVSDKLKVERGVVLDAIRDLARQRRLELPSPLYQLVITALAVNMGMAAAKSASFRIFSALSPDRRKREHYRARCRAHSDSLRASTLVLKLILA
jgi:glycosyltransferase involved in cell wall biosynthesis